MTNGDVLYEILGRQCSPMVEAGLAGRAAKYLLFSLPPYGLLHTSNFVPFGTFLL